MQIFNFFIHLATEWYCSKCGAHLGTTQGGEGRAEVVCAACSKK
jgi:DNA-directed RNA polymerase subunit RPC12/RpoP